MSTTRGGFAPSTTAEAHDGCFCHAPRTIQHRHEEGKDMTPWRKNIGCAAIAAGLLFGAAATALAHTMPIEEATMILRSEEHTSELQSR